VRLQIACTEARRTRFDAIGCGDDDHMVAGSLFWQFGSARFAGLRLRLIPA